MIYNEYVTRFCIEIKIGDMTTLCREQLLLITHYYVRLLKSGHPLPRISHFWEGGIGVLQEGKEFLEMLDGLGYPSFLRFFRHLTQLQPYLI